MPLKEEKKEFDNFAFESNEAPNAGEEASPEAEKAEAKPKQPDMISILGMFRYADALDKVLILLGTVVALASAAIYPLMFLLYGSTATVFVDQAKNSTGGNFSCPAPESNESYDNRLDRNINYYVAAGFTSLFLNYVFSVCFDTAAERQTKRIRNLLFKSMVIQEMAFFDKNNPGDLASRITSNVLTLKMGFNFKFGDFISLAGRGIGCLVLAFASSWKFSLVFMAIIPFLTGFTFMLFFTIKKYTVREFQSYGDAGKIAQEVLSSLRTVVSFGTMKKEIKNYETNLKKAESEFIRKGRVTGIFLGLTLGLFNILFGVAIYYATYLTRTECIAPGTVIQSLMALITSTFALGQAGPFLKDLAEARGAALKIFEIIEKKPEIETYRNEDRKRIEHFRGQISFRNVFFSYPQRKQTTILKGLNMDLEAGKTIALCGSSGGGKSTVIQLLQRFYDPTSGVITIDGENIETLELSWLRSQMALVSQEPVLFSTTIRENIRMGRKEATDEDIFEAAKLANVHDFIMSTVDGYDTHVGERGAQLSGGQKQRVAIARAILRNPKILLLDEATSALDNQSEKVVQEALDRAKVGRTTIIIAHRLTTIRNADLIIAMDKGQIGEMGTHEALMAKQGLYYDLVTSQTREGDAEPVDSKKEVVAFKKMKSVESAKNKEKEEEEEVEELEMEETDEKGVKRVRKEKASLFYLGRKMWQLNRPELFYAIFAAICQIICSLVNPVVSLIFSEIYNLFATSDPKKQEADSLKYMGIIIGIGFVNFACMIVHHTSFAVVGGRLTTRIRLRMFESMLRQEMAYHDQEENRSSILATRLAATVPFCKGLTSDYLNLICQSCAGVGFSIVVSFIINWKLSLVMMAFIPAVFISGITSINSISGNKGKGKSTNEEGGQLATEIIENIKTVVSLGKERHFVRKFEAIYDKNFQKTLLKLHMQGFFYGLSNSILFFIQAAAFSFGFYLIKRDELTVTNLFRVYASITFSSMALGRVFAQMPDTKKTTEAALIALKTINRKSKIDSMSEEGIRPATLRGEIKFNDVHFNYPSRPKLKVLQGLTLSVKPGQVNALVGSSGCGKSTTVALLLRFYDVHSGSVTIDGIDVRDLNIQWLRSQIGLVSQEPTLFNTTIRNNIIYGIEASDQVSDQDVRNVAKDANIGARIESLPDKYETIVGTKGGQLSGGEKQRVAIARALLRQPKILLLDEATSALDSQSEQVVQDTLDAAQKGRTCIVIAHRLSTIQNSDKISAVDKGRVVEEGTHQELLNNRGLYYKLNSQNVAH